MILLTAAVQPSAPAGTDFADLILPHLDQLQARARGLERSPVDAGDLVQDTLERALRTYHRLRPGSNVRVWLFTIMLHLFIDRRRRRRHEVLVSPDTQTDIPSPVPESRPEWESVAEDDLRTAVETLGSGFRDILLLRLAERQSYREIGDKLQIPVNTVGTRLLRARKKLRAILTARPTVA